MADNRITRKRLKNHFAYGWWKYLLCAFLCAMAVDMLFAMTAYRPPADKKIEMYLCSGYADAITFEQDMWPVLQEAYPEQEELTVLNIDISSGEMTAVMQFATYTAAQQGDVCLLPAGEVEKLTADGADNAFLDLTAYIESGVIDVSGIDLTAGTLPGASGEMGVYAIPADGLYGLLDYGCDPAGSMLCVMAYGGNLDTAAGFVGALIDALSAPMPEGYGREAAEQTVFPQVLR